MLRLLAVLAGMAVLASDLGALPAWALAVPVTGYGWLVARRERQQRPRTLVIGGNPRVCRIDGRIVEALEVRWRGPIAFVTWREPCGTRRRLTWWPDTLPRRSRRELRLAASDCRPTPRAQSMAP